MKKDGYLKIFIILIFCMITHVTQAQRLNTDSLKAALHSQHGKTKINTYIKLIDTTKDTAPTQCLQYIDDALQLAILEESLLQQAIIYNQWGRLLTYLGEYEQALEKLFKSLELNEDLNEAENIADNHVNIAVIFHKMGDYNQAIQYYFKALDYYVINGDKKNMAKLYNNMAGLYYERKEYPKALEFYTKAMSLYQNVDYQTGVLTTLINVGATYELMDDYEKALAYGFEALHLSRKLNDRVRMTIALTNISSVRIKLAQSEKAITTLEEALGMAIEISSKPAMAESYFLLSEAYISMGDTGRAFFYYRQYVQTKDSILSIEKNGQMLDMQARYNTQKKEQQIQELNLKRRETLNIFLGIISGLVFLLAAVFFYQYRMQNKRNLYLAEKNEEIMKSQQRIAAMNEELKIAKRKAMESDMLKTNFLANMSHEIRTPLNAVLGFSELMKRPDISDSKKEGFYGIIHRNLTHLLALIDDILDMSKIEARQLKLHPKKTSLYSLIQELYNFFEKEKHNIKKSHIKLELKENREGVNEFVIADRERLYQILANLLDNAFKFTDSGSIEFGYQLKNNMLEFYVVDTGIGIPEKKQKNIFRRFRQVDSSLTREFGGTGLGLAISKALVEMMGGTINVTSHENEGAMFTFSIPYKEAEE